jgi:hypothetical protein
MSPEMAYAKRGFSPTPRRFPLCCRITWPLAQVYLADLTRRSSRQFVDELDVARQHEDWYLRLEESVEPGGGEWRPSLPDDKDLDIVIGNRLPGQRQIRRHAYARAELHSVVG